MSDSHIVKSTTLLRQLSYNYEIMEHSFYNPKTKQTTKHDFCGFADILAWSPRQFGFMLAIQVCGEDILPHTSRYKDPRQLRGRRRLPIGLQIERWIESGHAFQIWSWRKNGNLLRVNCVVGRMRNLNFPVIRESSSNLEKGCLV